MIDSSDRSTLVDAAVAVAVRTSYSHAEIMAAVDAVITIRRSEGRTTIPIVIWLLMLEPGSRMAASTGTSLREAYSALADGVADDLVILLTQEGSPNDRRPRV